MDSFARNMHGSASRCLKRKRSRSKLSESGNLSDNAFVRFQVKILCYDGLMEVATNMATEKKVVKIKVYSSPKQLGENEKCPPQAKLILKLIAENAVDGKIERDALITLLKRPPAEGGLETRQSPERILGFYRPRLVEQGVLLEETIDREIEVEVPDKPAKAETPAAADGSTPADGAAAAPQETKSKSKGAKGTPQTAAA